MRSARHGPVKIKARIEESDRTRARVDMLGKFYRIALCEGDRIGIRRQAVKLWAKKSGETFEPIQRSGS